MTYPCDYCGECPIWLAAYDDERVDTYEKILAECEKRNCHLVGKEVIDEFNNIGNIYLTSSKELRIILNKEN
jgi:hypothetical protein